jgi:threonine/homoserine/homoserine lactone efflux protein
LQATLVNALNPNPYIFWSVVAGPILLEGWRQSARLGISFVIGFYGTLIGGFAGFILLFASARRLDPRLSRILSAISAIALLVFGLYQLWLGIIR